MRNNLTAGTGVTIITDHRADHPPSSVSSVCPAGFVASVRLSGSVALTLTAAIFLLASVVDTDPMWLCRSSRSPSTTWEKHEEGAEPALTATLSCLLTFRSAFQPKQCSPRALKPALLAGVVHGAATGGATLTASTTQKSHSRLIDFNKRCNCGSLAP
ncbi:hypothetical protein MHYP_G00063100 [Metynnis hypsauchen]